MFWRLMCFDAQAKVNIIHNLSFITFHSAKRNAVRSQVFSDNFEDLFTVSVGTEASHTFYIGKRFQIIGHTFAYRFQ